jgi:hypothetical protein
MFVIYQIYVFNCINMELFEENKKKIESIEIFRDCLNQL